MGDKMAKKTPTTTKTATKKTPVKAPNATGKAAAKKADKPKITGDMTLGEAITKHPQTMEVLFRYGMHCIGCHISAYETIEQGALAHGMSKEEVKKMIEEMNKRA